jgi:hypothetical protein
LGYILGDFFSQTHPVALTSNAIDRLGLPSKRIEIKIGSAEIADARFQGPML